MHPIECFNAATSSFAQRFHIQHAGYDVDVPATIGIRLVSAHTFSRSDIFRTGAVDQAGGFEIQGDDTVDLELVCKCSVSKLTVCCKSARPIHFRVWHSFMAESVQPVSLLIHLGRKQACRYGHKRRDASGRTLESQPRPRIFRKSTSKFWRARISVLQFRDL